MHSSMSSSSLCKGEGSEFLPLAAVIKQADLSAAGLLEAVGNAERERAATPSEAPLSEWEVTRIKPDYGTHLTTQVLLANSEEAKAALQVKLKFKSMNIAHQLSSEYLPGQFKGALVVTTQSKYILRRVGSGDNSEESNVL